jgi:pSer/pThr/pTyr-binding forkhead associated (FHA) protein
MPPVTGVVSAIAPPAPSPAHAPSRTALLVLVGKDGVDGARFELRNAEQSALDIGRSEGDVVVRDPFVSPRHARIALRNGTYVLRDLESTNGVFLRLRNDPAREGSVEAALADQDLFLVGQQVLMFEVVKDAEAGFGTASQHGTLIFGTPAAPRYARLSQRTVEGITRDVFYVRKEETVFGREAGDIVFPDDPFLSRRHAVLRVDATERRFFLSDVGSSNGTFLRVRGEVTLCDGDQFRIGQQLFRVAIPASPEPGRPA